MNNQWTVDPDDNWRKSNEKWLLEANLPNTTRCPDTLTNIRCELVAGHESTHMIYMATVNPRDPKKAS